MNAGFGTGTWIVGLSLAVATSAPALVMDIEGDATSGLNDGAATAQEIGTIPSAGPIGVYFDIDLAEDVGVSDDDDIGLDAELWVFDPAGRLIANNDDSDFFRLGSFNAGTDPGSDPWADHDPFIGELLLAPGMYLVAVTYYNNDANGEFQGNAVSVPLSDSGDAILDTTPDTTFDLAATCGDPSDPAEQCTGMYTLFVRTTFADSPDALHAMGWIDVNNHNDVDFYAFTVPEPSGLLLLGLAALGLTRRCARD